jgi:hypothetical protein
VLAYFGYRHFSSDAAPSAAEVEPALRSFLSTGKGNCSVGHLSDVSIGERNEQFGGWPVYASHEETCQEGDSSVTYSGLEDAAKQVAVAFVRRGAGGGIELYVPQFFKEARQQMQGALDSATAN